MPKKESTLEEQFEALRPSLEKRAAFILQDAQYLCDDALSETYVKAWTRFSTFDPKKATFSTWIHTILENTCHTLIRNEKKQKAKKGTRPR
jgi:RNA polymerase sigma factor (sigma-70 family)